MKNGKLRFADFYGSGAVLGFSPGEVRAMSLWEFSACVDGWNAAHGGSKPEAPDGEELLEALTNGLK